jgi:hypothetical protein
LTSGRKVAILILRFISGDAELVVEDETKSLFGEF